jgi:hypothetical protein
MPKARLARNSSMFTIDGAQCRAFRLVMGSQNVFLRAWRITSKNPRAFQEMQDLGASAPSGYAWHFPRQGASRASRNC